MPTDTDKRIDTEPSLRDAIQRYDEIYVCFRNKIETPGSIAKWLPWLNKSFGHCYIILKGKKTWLYCDPLIHGLIIIEVENLTIDENFPQYVVDNSEDKILEFGLPKASRLFNWHVWFGLFNCVTICKFFIGIEGWTITPYQLWKKLLKLGATELTKTIKEINNG